MLKHVFMEEDNDAAGGNAGGIGSGGTDGGGAGGADDGGTFDGGVDGGAPTGGGGAPGGRQQRRDVFNDNLELRRQLETQTETNRMLQQTLQGLQQTLEAGRKPPEGSEAEAAYAEFERASARLDPKDPKTLREWTIAHQKFIEAGLTSGWANKLREQIREEMRQSLPPQRAPHVQRIFNEFSWLEGDDDLQSEVLVETKRAARRHGVKIVDGRLQAPVSVIENLMREGALAVAREYKLRVPGGGHDRDDGARDRFSNSGGRNGGGGGGAPGGMTTEQTAEIDRITAQIGGGLYKDMKTGQLKPLEERVRVWTALRKKEAKAQAR